MLSVSLSVIIFEIFDVQFWWFWTRTVQGHPTSKVMVSIERSFMISYLTSIVSNIVSLVVFEISDAEDHDLGLGRLKVIQRICHRFEIFDLILMTSNYDVQGHPESKVMVPIDSPWVTSYSTFIDPTSYLSPFLKYLTCNFDDLKLEQFKVIQGQKSSC